MGSCWPYLLTLLLCCCSVVEATGINTDSDPMGQAEEEITLCLAPQATTIVENCSVLLFDYQQGELHSYQRESGHCQTWPLPQPHKEGIAAAALNIFAQVKISAQSPHHFTVFFGVQPALSRQVLPPVMSLFGKEIQPRRLTFITGDAPSPALAEILMQRQKITIHPICQRFDPSLLAPLFGSLPRTVIESSHTTRLYYILQDATIQRKRMASLCP